MKKQEQYERATIKLKNQQLLQNWSIFATVYISAIEKIPRYIEWVVCRYAILLDRLYSFAIYTSKLETNPMTICKIAKSITADDNNQSNVTSDKRLMGF